MSAEDTPFQLRRWEDTPGYPKGCWVKGIERLGFGSIKEETETRQGFFEGLKNSGLLVALLNEEIALPVKLETPGFEDRPAGITPWRGGLTIEKVDKILPRLQQAVANFGLENPQYLIGAESKRPNKWCSILYDGVFVEVRDDEVLIGPMITGTFDEPDTFQHITEYDIRIQDSKLLRIDSFNRLRKLVECADFHSPSST